MSGGRGEWNPTADGDKFQTVSMVAMVAGKPVSSRRDGDAIEVALKRIADWDDDVPPMVSVRRTVVAEATGTGVAELDIKREERKRKAGNGGSWVGRTVKLGWLTRGEAESLAYALLAAVEEIGE